jgi:glycosyltransferase involved in cell wall biosynthesis
MKPIVLISGDFAPTGGMDRANHALAGYLAQRGRPVHLVAYRVAEDLLACPNVVFHRALKPAGSYLLGDWFLRRAGRSWARRVSRQGGRALVNGGNCSFGDVNWVHYVHAAHKPVAHGHALRRLKRAWTHRTARTEERRALRRARLVIANSERTRTDLLEHLDLAEGRVRTIYYGVDQKQFRPLNALERAEVRARLSWPSDRPVALFVGALGDRRKGFDTLFAAWTRLCGRPDWDADLKVIGRGAELPAWQARTEASGLTGRVEYLGFRRDVPDLLSACDVLVAPTRYEAYGLGVHEALCCGAPAFVSRFAGVAERYPPHLHEFLLEDPDDVQDLADRLVAWRGRLETHRAATVALAEELRQYTWDHMAEQIVQQMEAVE